VVPIESLWLESESGVWRISKWAENISITTLFFKKKKKRGLREHKVRNATATTVVEAPVDSSTSSCMKMEGTPLFAWFDESTEVAKLQTSIFLPRKIPSPLRNIKSDHVGRITFSFFEYSC
jgi:hypothetical protein